LKDASTQTPPSIPTPSPTPNEPVNNNNPTSTEPTSGAPESYDFKTPEGQPALDKAVLDAATPIFKELNLSQSQAQKLVDFYNTQMKAQTENITKTVNTMREGWVNEVKADTEMGPKLDQIKADIGRAFDALGDTKLVNEFKSAMDLTGAGDHPAFVRAFWKLSQRVIEGKPVSGGGPSPNGQNSSGQVRRPSLASAMYPNLPQ